MLENYEQRIVATGTNTRGKTRIGVETGTGSAALASITAADSTLQLGGSTSVSPTRKGKTQ